MAIKQAAEVPARAAGVIQVRGAREHNLKNIDVAIPRDQLTVITGQLCLCLRDRWQVTTPFIGTTITMAGTTPFRR